MKKCNKCGADKPLDQFYPKRGKCKPCLNEQYRELKAAWVKEDRKRNPEKYAAYEQRKRAKIKSSPELLAKEQARQRDKQKRAYLADPEKLRERRRQYHAAHRDASNEAARQYKKRNPDKIKELNLKWNHIDRAARKLRVPAWLTDEDRVMMTSMYREARRLGLHVDHIVPLQGKLVSGLHVPQNLQLLHPSENCSKKNYFEI